MRFLLLFLVLCFCVPAMAEEKVSVSYGEPWGASFRFWAEQTKGEYAAFLFDSALDAETRQGCVAAVDELLRQLPPMEKPEICVVPQRLFTGAVIDGNRLYISPMDWQSVDFAALVLQAAAGEFSHYGLAYGLAGWLRGQSGEFAVMQEPAAYDLNLLCFDTDFVPETDATNARTLSVCFATEYIAAHGSAAYLSLLLESDTENGAQAAAEVLQQYYTAHGVVAEVSALRFAQGGKAYRYRVQVEGAVFHVGREWQDANHALNPLVSENFLHEDYASVRTFFCINELQMAQYRQLFATNGPWEDVAVLLLNPQRRTNTSRYLLAEHSILLLNVDSLTHEYIHALMQPRPTQTLWETEGIARYFSFYYDHYGLAFLNADYNDPPDLEHVQFVRAYREAIGRPIDMAVDFGELESLGAYSRKDQSPNESYSSGSAFVHYLVQRFGAEAVIRHVGGQEALPQDISVLTADWLAWLNDTYQGFTVQNDLNP